MPSLFVCVPQLDVAACPQHILQQPSCKSESALGTPLVSCCFASSKTKRSITKLKDFQGRMHICATIARHPAGTHQQQVCENMRTPMAHRKAVTPGRLTLKVAVPQRATVSGHFARRWAGFRPLLVHTYVYRYICTYMHVFAQPSPPVVKHALRAKREGIFAGMWVCV